MKAPPKPLPTIKAILDEHVPLTITCPDRLDDAEFGDALIKVCTYAPYGMKIYLNGHEWAKRE